MSERTAVTIEQAMQIAVGHLQAGRLTEAEAICRQIVVAHPEFAGALHLAGFLAYLQGRNDEAIELIRRAIAIQGDVPEAHNHLADALRKKGRMHDAISAYRRAIELKKDFAEAQFHLGDALMATRQLDAAIDAYREAIRIQPDYVSAMNNLGIALCQKKRLDESIAVLREAQRIQPDLAVTYNNLGNSLRGKGQLEEAIAAFRQCLRLNGNSPEAYNNLGNALRDKEDLGGAIAALRQAILIKPDSVMALSNLGNGLRDAGEIEQAIEACRAALRIRPDEPKIHSNLIFLEGLDPGYDAQAILQEARRWADRFERPLAGQIKPHGNDRRPDRRLRIGYVSPDLRKHPIGRFLTLLLANHDPKQVDVFCYSDVILPDDITRRLKELTHVWRDVFELNDAQLAEQIRADQIDILVDQALHTAENRLPAFARKPAPVQVTWLGYPGTSGMRTMDYRLTDPFIDPPGENDQDYSETSIRLPHCFWCYEPGEGPPDVNSLPALENGFVTFGCFNGFGKVGPATRQLWIEVMRAMPTSRLIFLCVGGEFQEAFEKTFEDAGVSRDRLEPVPRFSTPQYFAAHHRVDMCLDPTPYSGHTTTCDAVWMGVPTVTLRGRTAVGRGAASILSNIGLADWIAQAPRQYVSIAQSMAADLPKLAELRSDLRRRMRDGPLMNGKQYASDLEAIYRSMWERWCGK